MSTNEQVKIIEAKAEHIAVKGKWEERKIHAYSMLAIRIGAILLALAISLAILLK